MTSPICCDHTHGPTAECDGCGDEITQEEHGFWSHADNVQRRDHKATPITKVAPPCGCRYPCN